MIHITNNYYLDADKYSYVVLDRQIVQKGKHKGAERFVPVGYHTSFKACFGTIGEFLVRDGIESHWSEKVFLRRADELIEAINRLDSPTMTESFFSAKKKAMKK